MDANTQWYEDNPAACLNGSSKRPTMVWGKADGKLMLSESNVEDLFCPRCPRRPCRSERCVQRKPGVRPVRRRGLATYAARNHYSEDDLAARVGEMWLELGKAPRVTDLKRSEKGKPSARVILGRLGGIGCALNAGKSWLKKEGKWRDGLE